MAFEVLVTEDYERMSEAAARILVPRLRAVTVAEKKLFGLGLATGSSPVGLCHRMAERQDQFDARKVRSWNLDEYVGLPGETASDRAMHPESYRYHMIRHLFGRLEPTFAEMSVPLGTEIEQKGLIEALDAAKECWHYEGTDKGKAIIIEDGTAKSPSGVYLQRIKQRFLDAYVQSIKQAGGIDCWVVGVGGRGHIAFHESGIPLEHKILLVKLDDNTVENAVNDGHFRSKEEAPWYAISMGAGGVLEYSGDILLLAYGERKTGPIAESLLGGETADVPISILQRCISDPYKNTMYVLDEAAAKGIFGKEKQLAEKGITVRDLRV